MMNEAGSSRSLASQCWLVRSAWMQTSQSMCFARLQKSECKKEKQNKCNLIRRTLIALHRKVVLWGRGLCCTQSGKCVAMMCRRGIKLDHAAFNYDRITRKSGLKAEKNFLRWILSFPFLHGLLFLSFCLADNGVFSSAFPTRSPYFSLKPEQHWFNRY